MKLQVINKLLDDQFSIEDIINKCIKGDIIKILKKLPDNSIDMCFVDPPYFLQIPDKQKKINRWRKSVKEKPSKYRRPTEEWDKFETFHQFDKFINDLFLEIKRVLKPEGTFWVIGSYHCIYRFGYILQELNYHILNDVAWIKNNPTPNFLGVRMTNMFEHLIWCLNEKGQKYTFDKTIAKRVGLGTIGGNIWILPPSTGKERLKDENGDTLHPTQKPIELLRRIIMISSKENDIILDPCAGTLTTSWVAYHLNRRFIAIERDEKYINGAIDRFENVMPNLIEQKEKKYTIVRDDQIQRSQKKKRKNKQYEEKYEVNFELN